MSANSTASACTSRAFPDVSGFISMLKDAFFLNEYPPSPTGTTADVAFLSVSAAATVFLADFLPTCVRFMQHWFEIFLLRFSASQSSKVRGITQSCQNIYPYLEVFMGEQGLIWIPNFMEALIFTADWQIVRKMLNTNPISVLFLPVICSYYTGNIPYSND